MKAERLYDKLPGVLQTAACSLYGWNLWRHRYGRHYKAIEREVQGREFMDEEALWAFQAGRLRRMVEHAATTVPYYREQFKQLGIDYRDVRGAEDLAGLPVLDKETVQARLGDFVSERVGEMAVRTTHTSGTTGAALVFPMTWDADREQQATWWRYRRRFGVDRSMWHGHFYGRPVVSLERERPPFWRVNYPGRQIFFSGYHLRDEWLGYYVAELNRRRPSWIQGYPSFLSLLAGYMLAEGNALDYQPRVVMVGAETLLDQQKELIARAFGTAPRQHYGMTEAVANFSECPAGNLHVDEDFSCVEFVSEGGANRAQGGVQPRQLIVGTGLVNEAFVLLRYAVGDMVTGVVAKERCVCGRPGRVVCRVAGRTDDYVITPRGARISWLGVLFKDMVNIREAQVVQRYMGQIELHLVRMSSFTEKDKKRLLKEARRRLGSDMSVQVVYKDELERSRSGKLKQVVSCLPRGQMDEVIKAAKG